MKAKTYDRSGIALVLTIVMLVMLTLLVVGMASMMRLERKGASFYDRQIAAQQLAQAGVMRVVATLKATIPATLDNNRYYISMPGKVIGVDNTAGATNQVTVGFLYSTGTNSVVGADNMNATSLSQYAQTTSYVELNAYDVYGSLTPPIVPTNNFYILNPNAGPSMAMSFSAVGPTLPFAIGAGWTPVKDASGVLIGRYAYWTDDNNTRINVNSAYRRTSMTTMPLNSTVTSVVDLRDMSTWTGIGGVEGITSDMASTSSGYMGATAFRGANNAASISTTERVKTARLWTEDIFRENSFYLTAWGTNDADTDIFGRDRIYFNNLTADNPPTVTINADLHARLSSNKEIVTPEGTVTTPKGDWTKIFPGITKDFLSKYPIVKWKATDTAGLGAGQVIEISDPDTDGLQLIANMIDFTKPNSSPTVTYCIHDTLVADPNNVNYGLPMRNGHPSYLGLKVSPYLNEIVFNNTPVTKTTGGGNATFSGTATVAFELIQPYLQTVGAGYQIAPWIDVVVEISTPTGTVTETFTVKTPLNISTNIARGYTTAAASPRLSFPWTTEKPYPDTSSFIQAFFMVKQVRLLATQTGDPHNAAWGDPASIRDYLSNDAFIASGYNTANWPYGIRAYPSGSDRGVGKDDPRVPNVWKYETSGVVTLGIKNWPSGTTGFTIDAPGNDGSETTSIHLHSTFVITGAAFAAGATVTSLGTLGFVHTGRPWRTLRFQPRPATESDSVPDWAIMDIFALAGPTNTGTVGNGRINVNQRIDEASGLPPLRRAPLLAMFQSGASSGMRTNTGAITELGSLSDPVIKYVGAINQTQKGTSRDIGAYAGMVLPGEICEVVNLTNSQTATPPITDAQKEYAIRQTAPLITTRSKFFTVWCVGQSIVDNDRNGVFNPNTDAITGESRVQAVIEIVPTSTITALPASRYGTITTNTYRIVYLKFITD